jgi:hypothetical protein
MSAPWNADDGATRPSIGPLRLDPAAPGPLDGIACQLTTDPDFASLHRDDPMRSDAAHELVVAIGARLRNVCSHLSDEAFASLVLDVARSKARFTRLEHDWVGRVLP